MEDGGGQRAGAGPDEAYVGFGVGRRVLEQDLMDCRHGCVPICLVGDEVSPEVGGGELPRYDHGTTSVEGRQEAAEETVDME